MPAIAEMARALLGFKKKSMDIIKGHFIIRHPIRIDDGGVFLQYAVIRQQSCCSDPGWW